MSQVFVVDFAKQSKILENLGTDGTFTFLWAHIGNVQCKKHAREQSVTPDTRASSAMFIL